MGSLEGQKKQSWLPTGLLRADLLFPPLLCCRHKSSFAKKVPVIGLNTMAAAPTLGEVATETQIQGIINPRARGATKSHLVQFLAFRLNHSLWEYNKSSPLTLVFRTYHTWKTVFPGWKILASLQVTFQVSPLSNKKVPKTVPTLSLLSF